MGAGALEVAREANARSDRVVTLERTTSFYRDLRDDLHSQLLGVTTALASSGTRRYDDAARQFELARFNLDRLAIVAADDADRVHEIEAIYREFRSIMERVLDLGRAAKVTEARELYATQGRSIGDRLDRRMGELVRKAEVEVFEAVEASRMAMDRSQLFVALLAATAVFLAGAVGLALSLSLIRPIADMDTALARIGGGDFSARIAVANRDELGRLARNLNRMTEELGNAYAQLDAANRHKSEFLASMSHELRTPLNAIIGFSEVLLQKIFGDLNPKQEEYLRDVVGSGRHQLALVNDILDLSKVEAGKMELERAPTSVAQLVETCLVLVRGRAVSHGIALSATVAPDVGSISADERKLKQIILNLLSNAVKYTPDGGRVDVTALRQGAWLVIAVKDTGAGIAAEDQARIFEEFQQTSVGRKTEGSTGLGLSLARKLVELHGGTIAVESEVGAGSTFTVRLPA